MRDEAKRLAIEVEFGTAMLEMQGKQAAVFTQNQELLQANEALKRQIATHQHWESEVARYLLHDVGNGAFVFALKAGGAAGQPPHWLCVACFHERTKSLLQNSGRGLWRCPVNPRHSVGMDDRFSPTLMPDDF